MILQASAQWVRHPPDGRISTATQPGKALEIPEDYALGSVMALGYQDEPGNLSNEKLIENETTPRTRKPLSEFALTAWGEPADFI